jgi:hypothetical protein
VFIRVHPWSKIFFLRATEGFFNTTTTTGATKRLKPIGFRRVLGGRRVSNSYQSVRRFFDVSGAKIRRRFINHEWTRINTNEERLLNAKTKTVGK